MHHFRVSTDVAIHVLYVCYQCLCHSYMHHFFRFSTDVANVPTLLDLLLVLPEEMNCRALRLGTNRRARLTEMFTRSCRTVLELLLVSLTHWPNDVEIKTRVIVEGVYTISDTSCHILVYVCWGRLIQFCTIFIAHIMVLWSKSSVCIYIPLPGLVLIVCLVLLFRCFNV